MQICLILIIFQSIWVYSSIFHNINQFVVVIESVYFRTNACLQ